MLSSNDLRKGVIYLEDKQALQVLDFKHQKYGRGQATIKVKVKNIETGVISEKTYDPSSKLEEADTEKRTVQFLYEDGEYAHFMDTGDYNQVRLPLDEVTYELNYLVEGESCVALFLDSAPVALELPKAVQLEVIEAPEAVSGDTSSGATKQVKLNTGLEVAVPLFIKKGDVLKINTDNGEYIERINK